uniref:C2H2-type domain-containing protein n=1 Tax=Tetraodon nigroviridis TaxID=99883 RepID=H3BXM0_TETNG
YACQECGRGFAYASDLLHHQDLKHTLPKPHRCRLCGQEFSLRSSLQLHQCARGSAHPYACAPCGRGFSQKQALLHHQQAGCSKPPSEFPCPSCAEVFSLHSQLKEHVELH